MLICGLLSTFTLWSDDFVKFKNYLTAGLVVFITGSFKQRWNKAEYEFKISSISLLENLMKTCTKKIQVEVHPKHIDGNVIEFIDKNVKEFPGRSTLKFCLAEPAANLKVGMYTLANGFEMNDEMAHFLQQKPEMQIMVEAS
jgi:DNA polymerase-3 subunit alpha